MAELGTINELISNVILDTEIAAVATRDAWSIIQATNPSDAQALSIARGEAWRQMRARGVFPHDIPTIELAGDPVAALSIIERTALSLSLRFHLETPEVAQILGENQKSTAAIIKTARRELARAAIAITALTNPTRCPVMSQSAINLGQTITRGQAMNLVSHCAECSICVPVLRTVDRQIVSDYSQAPMQELASEISEATIQSNPAELVTRAKLKDGWAPRDINVSRDPRKMLQRTIIFGAISTLLIALGLWLGFS